MSDLISTGHDKFLGGRIFIYSRPFTRNRANSVADYNTVYWYTGPYKFLHCFGIYKALFWISSVIDYSCCIKSIELDKSIMLHKSKLWSN